VTPSTGGADIMALPPSEEATACREPVADVDGVRLSGLHRVAASWRASAIRMLELAPNDCARPLDQLDVGRRRAFDVFAFCAILRGK
jgi:hypothetical protein